MDQLIGANIHFLDQAEALLERLQDDEYGCAVENFYGSTLGQHVRHCLDHYRSFLKGLDDGRIDYDCRMREVAIESSTEDALAVLREVRGGLEELIEYEKPMNLEVKMDCGGSGEDWQPSSLGRELQFLVSHTVHHFAMIGGMCGCLGLEVEGGFGVAPSTLRFREKAGID
ncbi:MAG: DinB family protein [Verrucomicrobiaceae bacterium]